MATAEMGVAFNRRFKCHCFQSFLCAYRLIYQVLHSLSYYLTNCPTSRVLLLLGSSIRIPCYCPPDIQHEVHDANWDKVHDANWDRAGNYSRSRAVGLGLGLGLPRPSRSGLQTSSHGIQPTSPSPGHCTQSSPSPWSSSANGLPSSPAATELTPNLDIPCPNIPRPNIPCFNSLKLWSPINNFCDVQSLGRRCNRPDVISKSNIVTSSCTCKLVLQHGCNSDGCYCCHGCCCWCHGYRELFIEEAIYLSLKQTLPEVDLSTTDDWMQVIDNCAEMISHKPVAGGDCSDGSNKMGTSSEIAIREGDEKEEDAEEEDEEQRELMPAIKRRRRETEQLKSEQLKSEQLKSEQSESEQSESYFNRGMLASCGVPDSQGKQIFEAALKLGSDPVREKVKIAVYLWWKSRGWVVKSGLKFGVDYLIYDKPEDEVHARYGLAIASTDMQWRHVNRLSRLASAVIKDLILVTPSIDQSAITNYNLQDLISLPLVQVKIARGRRHQIQQQQQ